jgi:hypothetical protein
MLYILLVLLVYLVKGERNCYYASESEDAMILQVFHKVRHDRLGTLVQYAQHFAGQVYLLNARSEADYPPGEELWNNLTVAHCHGNFDEWDMGMAWAMCLARVLNQILTMHFAGDNYPHTKYFGDPLVPNPACKRVPIAGVLVHHMDFWVHPKLLVGMLDKKKVWLPARCDNFISNMMHRLLGLANCSCSTVHAMGNTITKTALQQGTNFRWPF